MNPILRFLQEQIKDKLDPDLSSPAKLSLTQAILLEHAKDMDAISGLIADSYSKTVTGNPEFDLQIDNVQPPQQKNDDLWVGPAN